MEEITKEKMIEILNVLHNAFAWTSNNRNLYYNVMFTFSDTKDYELIEKYIINKQNVIRLVVDDIFKEKR